jgi:uncharacterized protein YegL
MPRRLPIYILVDTSESMAGAAFGAIREGLASMVSALRSDPRCLETAHVCMITFGGPCKVAVALTPVEDFSVPPLKLGTGTNLGGAIKAMLAEFDAQAARRAGNDGRPDWRPLCFLLSDGQPTDEWREQAKALRARHDSGKCAVMALGCGPDVDLEALRAITPSAFRTVSDASNLEIAAFFRWVSASVRTASVAADGKPDTDRPPAIAGVERVAEAEPGESGKRGMYLVARCQAKRLPYVIKHRWNNGCYEPTSAELVDDIDMSGSPGMEANSDQIAPCPCPRCGNPIWGMCSCGRYFCCPSDSGRFTCPWCESTADFAPAKFTVTGSGG